MNECVFCKIARKEIASKWVGESSEVAAFRDINPQAPVHILIVPKKHIASVMDLQNSDSEIMIQLLKMAQSAARSEGVDKSGFRLVFNYGNDAGQAVDHLHLHLLGKRKLNWPPG